MFSIIECNVNVENFHSVPVEYELKEKYYVEIIKFKI